MRIAETYPTCRASLLRRPCASVHSMVNQGPPPKNDMSSATMRNFPERPPSMEGQAAADRSLTRSPLTSSFTSRATDPSPKLAKAYSFAGASLNRVTSHLAGGTNAVFFGRSRDTVVRRSENSAPSPQRATRPMALSAVQVRLQKTPLRTAVPATTQIAIQPAGSAANEVLYQSSMPSTLSVVTP